MSFKIFLFAIYVENFFLFEIYGERTNIWALFSKSIFSLFNCSFLSEFVCVYCQSQLPLCNNNNNFNIFFQLFSSFY